MANTPVNFACSPGDGSIGVTVGLEVMLREGLFKDTSVGLITNHTGLSRDLVSNVDLMLDAGYRIKALFSPEHGLFGYHADGASVSGHRDPRTGLPVYSLYGDTQAPTGEMLRGIDVVIFDIQDIGARYYTYISTMILALEECSKRGIPLVVLDRPNPLGGEVVEGNVPGEKWLSFVGAHPIPQRHGMTVGEIAAMVARERGFEDPVVVPVEGWKRRMYFPETGLQWVPTSPNVPTFDTAVVYPGTCLLEGTTVSEGRGTTWPFQYIGAPWVDGHALASRLKELNIPGVLFRPVYFRPAFGKWCGEVAGGVAIHVVNAREVRPVELGVRILFALRDLYPDHFQFRPPSANGAYFFDLLAGGPDLRSSLEKGDSPDDILREWDGQARAFVQRRRQYLIYD